MPIVFRYVWVKRESGENPERSRHCVREFVLISLSLSWEESANDDRSQETCLYQVILICGTRIRLAKCTLGFKCKALILETAI